MASALKKMDLAKSFAYMYSLLSVANRWGLTARKLRRFITLTYDSSYVQENSKFVDALAETYVSYVSYTVTVGSTVHALLDIIPFGNILSHIGKSLTRDYVSTLSNAKDACSFQVSVYLKEVLQPLLPHASLLVQSLEIMTSFFEHETLEDMYASLVRLSGAETTNKYTVSVFASYLKSLFKTIKTTDTYRDELVPMNVFVKTRKSLQKYFEKRANVNLNRNQIKITLAGHEYSDEIEFFKVVTINRKKYFKYHSEDRSYRISEVDVEKVRLKQGATPAPQSVKDLEKLSDSDETVTVGDVLPMTKPTVPVPLSDERVVWWKTAPSGRQMVCFNSKLVEEIEEIEALEVGDGVKVSSRNGASGKIRFSKDLSSTLYRVSNPYFVRASLEMASSEDTLYVLNVPYSLPYIFTMFVCLWRASNELPF